VLCCITCVSRQSYFIGSSSGHGNIDRHYSGRTSSHLVSSRISSLAGMPPPPPKTVSLPRKGSPSAPATANARVWARRYPINGSTNAIDTSLSAHPRTDPIKALNTLLRLLSSLPSRIGGCQYKLTPAEHALSLHLVSILDPFMYHGVRALAPNQVNSATSAPLTGLVQQPTEILDAILFHVDSKKDHLLHPPPFWLPIRASKSFILTS